jgi:hypothetical protein
MKLERFLNEESSTGKLAFNTPPKIINIITDIIKIEKNTVRKKRLQELKGILVGKYPSPQSLLNSLKGLKNKMSSLTEEISISKRKRRIGGGLLAALIAITTLIMPTAQAAASKSVEAPPEKKVEAPISNVEARVLSIGVKKEVWDKIYQELQDYLQKLATAEYQGKEAIQQLGSIFKKYGIEFAATPGAAGEYEPATDKVQLNWNTLMRLAKKDITLEKVFGTIRHEMAHRAQFDMLKKALNDRQFSDYVSKEFSKKYFNRVIEIGAFHDELKRRVSSMETDKLAKYLNNHSQNVIKNIVLLYPDSDSVVKAIHRAQPTLKNLMRSFQKDEGRAAAQMKIAKALVDKYQGIEKILESPGKVFQEEIMDFRENVRWHLKEAGKDPDRVAGGYKGLATRLTRDLKKTITPAQVKAYMKKMEKEKTSRKVKAMAKGKLDSNAYEYTAKYNILKGHFA